MAVIVTYRSDCSVIETLTGNIDSLGTDKEVTHNAFNETKTLNSGSTPPATKVAAFIQALDAGAATIDLTALIGTNSAPVDGTGLKVQVLKFKNLGANTISLTPGAVDGYDIFGSDFKVTLSQNQEVLLYGNDSTPDVGGTDKTLDLAGTTTQTCEIMIILG